MLKLKPGIQLEYIKEYYKFTQRQWNDIRFGLEFRDARGDLLIEINMYRQIYVARQKGQDILYDMIKDNLIEKVSD